MGLSFVNYQIKKEIVEEDPSSSLIKSMVYHKQTDVLEITFVSGRKYVYFGVGLGLYQRFCFAKSKGKFFHKYIKNINNFVYNHKS